MWLLRLTRDGGQRGSISAGTANSGRLIYQTLMASKVSWQRLQSSSKNVPARQIRNPTASTECRNIFLVSTQGSKPDIRDSQINPYRSRFSCTILSRRRQVLRRNHSRGRDSNSSRRRDPCQLWGASFRSSQVGRISKALTLTYKFTLLPWSLRPSSYRLTRQRSGGMA